MPTKQNLTSELFLPTTRTEIEARGWDAPDVVLVSGDAYIDHPSFAAGLIGRLLESAGYRVAVLAQPDWKSADPWRELGRPRLFYGVTGGNMDSMINHYTASRKRRNDDAYSPGGKIELRPDRCSNVYAQRCREAFKGVPVVLGGIEASLRRLPHYDFWADKVQPSMLVTSKADLLVFGLGDKPVLEIAARLDRGEPIRGLAGTCHLLGKNDDVPEGTVLPPFEEVSTNHAAFAEMTRLHQWNTNPFNATRLLQKHGDRTLVHDVPETPMTTAELDRSYDLPYQRRPHPMYGSERIPAFEMIKDSITIMRGCFGGCTFCSITSHEGRVVQSRSEQSILNEVETIAAQPEFKGTISDLGGPTANMYGMRCTKPEVEAKCRRLSCIHPKICPLLGASHKPTLNLLRKARAKAGVKRVFVASGIRMDLANLDEEFIEEVAAHHTGGHLKIAPEHVSDSVLNIMKKPSQDSCNEFADKFVAASKRAGKKQYVVPYFISSHPGSGVKEMIELAVFLKQRGYRPLQVQDFIPAPMDVAACMYWTGLDPITKKPVETVHRLRERKTQRALLQFFKPENYFIVRRALMDHGRKELIGKGPLALIPDQPPREAIEARRKEATYVHAEDAGVSKSVGYRPGRKGRKTR